MREEIKIYQDNFLLEFVSINDFKTIDKISFSKEDMLRRSSLDSIIKEFQMELIEFNYPDIPIIKISDRETGEERLVTLVLNGLSLDNEKIINCIFNQEEKVI